MQGSRRQRRRRDALSPGRSTPGRTDASQEQTDAILLAPLGSRADAFSNYVGETSVYSAEELIVDRANLVGLTASEMSVLIVCLHVVGANQGDSSLGVFTDRP